MIAKKESKGAFELLAQNLNDQLAANDDYLIFLVRQCLNHKVSADILNGFIQKVTQSKSPK